MAMGYQSSVSEIHNIEIWGTDSTAALRRSAVSNREISEINDRKREQSGDLKQQAIDAIELAKQGNPSRAGDDVFIKEQAAKSLGIKKRALYDRLKK
jgi:hypothetical protein